MSKPAPSLVVSDTAALVEVHDRLEKISERLEMSFDSSTAEGSWRALRSLRILVGQLPPCSPEQFAGSIGEALSKRRSK